MCVQLKNQFAIIGLPIQKKNSKSSLRAAPLPLAIRGLNLFLGKCVKIFELIAC